MGKTTKTTINTDSYVGLQVARNWHDSCSFPLCKMRPFETESPTTPEISGMEPTPTAGKSSSSDFRGTYFVCVDCDYVFTVSESVYAHHAFKTDCPQCDRPISIERVFVRDDMEIVELLGCEYSSRPVGKTPFSPIKQSEPSPLSPQAKFLEEFGQSKWIVEGKRGRQFTFQACASLREAIQRKELRAKDIVIAPDGSRFRLDHFPGTADLFGNLDKLAEARKYLEQRPQAPSQFKSKFLNFMFELCLFVAAGAALAFMALNGPDIWNRWQSSQEQSWFAHILEGASPISSNPQEMLAKAESRLDTKNPQTLSSSIGTFLGVLALEPKNTSALVGVADGWMRRAALQSSPSDVENSAKMIGYLQNVDPENVAITRLQAKHIWLTQGAPEAIAFLESHPVVLEKDLATRILLAQIALASKNHVKATIHLAEALTMDPRNIDLLETFVELFEEQEKWDEAAAYLRKLIDVSSNPNAYRRQLAELHERRGDLDLAKQVYLDLIASNQDQEEDHLHLLQLMEKENESDEMVKQAQVYFDRFPEGRHLNELRDLYQGALASLNQQVLKDSEESSKKSSKIRSSRRRRSSRR